MFEMTKSVRRYRKLNKKLAKAKLETSIRKAILPVLKKQAIAEIERAFTSSEFPNIMFAEITISESNAQDFYAVMKELNETYEITQTSTTTYLVKPRVVEIM